MVPVTTKQFIFISKNPPIYIRPILSALLERYALQERNPAGISPLLQILELLCWRIVLLHVLAAWRATGATHGGHNRAPNTGATSQSMDSDNPKISNGSFKRSHCSNGHPRSLSRSNKQLKHVKNHIFGDIPASISYPHDLAIWFSQLGFMMVKPLWYPHDAPFLS